MKNISLYIKLQFFSLLFMLALFVVPLALFYLFSPYPLPYIHFVFLGALIVSQYVFVNEKKYRHKNEKRCVDILSKELGRVPGHKEINERLIKMFQYHGISIIISGLLILIIPIFLDRF